MSRFDRYMLSQLLALFGFFSLVLVAVYWINQAVRLFDQLIGDGQSVLVFLELSILTLPNVIKLVLPISAFAATVYGINRLMQESELLVMQATGFSAMRLARPVLYFGLIVAAMLMLLGHVLVPASRATLALRNAEISQNVMARFLTDGQFMHPTQGITLYIREIADTGELRDVFLADDRSPNNRTTYTAKRALLVRSDTGPKLVMLEGMVQDLLRSDQRMSITRFADFTYDLAEVLAKRVAPGRTIETLSTFELLSPTEALLAETGRSAAALYFEMHSRISQPFLATAAALIGFSALLLGAFSRFGLWRQILFAVLLLIGMQLINTTTTSFGLRDPRGWPLVYAAPLTGLAVSLLLLWQAQRPRHRRRTRAAEAMA
ncbi:MAG: LPS export ABC transporter permease LptF [Pseudorhodobacter sp.]|nr:LPS export ABC transporter permease LptF [Pseudorhodobacter sp.]